MADTEIKASHLKANNAYGQNGSSTPSSLTPGQSKAPIADVAPKAASVPGLCAADTLAARVKMGDDGKAAEIAPRAGMKHRTPSDGSPGGVIDGSHSRRR